MAKQWRCVVCGQVFEAQVPPLPCPVCGAGEESFEPVEPARQAGRDDTDDHFVIIGGGTAALHAAKAVRKRNTTAALVMLTAENHLPYNRPALTALVGCTTLREKLPLEPLPFYSENNIDLRLGAVVEHVNPGDKQVVLQGGEALRYTKLLLATGAEPFNPVKATPGAIPVHVLRTLDDAEKLSAGIAGKRVVVVGGGILGLEAAAALARQGCAVTVVEFAPRILPLQTDEAASIMLAEALEKLGIVLLCGQSVQSATASGIVLTSGAQMAADAVLVSAGVRSEVNLALNMGLELSRGIVVDEYMHTSHDGIWAAGDCAEFGGQVLALAGAAASMGSVAGASMAGEETTPYVPFTPATLLNVEGLSLFSVGEVGQEPAQHALYEDKDKGLYKRLFFREGRLVGALFIGGHPGYKAVDAVAKGLAPAEALHLLQ